MTDDERHRAEIDGKDIAPVRVLSENFPACQVCDRAPPPLPPPSPPYTHATHTQTLAIYSLTRLLTPLFSPSQVCGRTDEYRIGLHDLADEIRGRKQKQREHLARINRAALQIQVW